MSSTDLRGQFSSEEVFDHLDASLKAFSCMTGVPVTFFSKKGEIMDEYASEKKVCNLFRVYSHKNSKCRSLLSFAGDFSSDLGEPYVFLCSAGLSNIAVPLVTEGSPSGFFIAGPFILKKLRNTNLRKFVRMNGLDETETDNIVNFAKDMPVMTPDEVSHLSLLFYNSIISALGVPGDYKGPRKLYEEQVLNSARIRKTKKEQKDLSFPYDLEKQLADSILMGNAAGSEELMLAIMDRLSVVCLGDLNEIKTMALWVTATIIKSLSDETRMQFGEFMDVDLDIINRINNSDSQKELTETFRSILDHLAKNMVSSVYSGSSALITQGLRIINRSYTDKITLSDISKSLHVNPTYFSSLFTREMGKTFSEYLMELRISKAEELLKNTGLSILDAATASGFDDQSYFTKVFRKHTGLTPGKYREQHS